MSETEQLNEVLRGEYNRLDVEKTVAISPAALANAAYWVIDPGELAPGLVRVAAILELRQLARAICRARNQEYEEKTEQGSLFDLQLQPRYPATRDDDEVYVLRAFLTYAERQQIASRLRKEADAKEAHAQALEAETKELVRAGKLKADTDGR